MKNCLPKLYVLYFSSLFPQPLHTNTHLAENTIRFVVPKYTYYVNTIFSTPICMCSALYVTIIIDYSAETTWKSFRDIIYNSRKLELYNV